MIIAGSCSLILRKLPYGDTGSTQGAGTAVPPDSALSSYLSDLLLERNPIVSETWAGARPAATHARDGCQRHDCPHFPPSKNSSFVSLSFQGWAGSQQGRLELRESRLTLGCPLLSACQLEGSYTYTASTWDIPCSGQTPLLCSLHLTTPGCFK